MLKTMKKKVKKKQGYNARKDEYKKENPDIILMNDKIIGPKKKKLKIPKYLTEELPVPTNE